MTDFVHRRTLTWAIVLWSGYVGTWAVITDSGRANVTLWWLAGTIFCGALWLGVQPGRRRHSLEALTASTRYRRSRDAGTNSSAEPAGPEAGRATAVRDWEDEAGATLSPDRR